MTIEELKKESVQNMNKGKTAYAMGMQYVLDNLPKELEIEPKASKVDSKAETIFGLETVLNEIVSQIEEYQNNEKYTKERFLDVMYNIIHGDKDEE